MKNKNAVENEMNVQNNKDLTLLSVFDVGIIWQWKYTFMRVRLPIVPMLKKNIENTKKLNRK